MSGFNAGDKVYVKVKDIPESHIWWNINPEARPKQKKLYGTVVNYDCDGDLEILFETLKTHYYMPESIVHSLDEDDYREFTMADLHDGDVCVTKNGRKLLFLAGSFLSLEDTSCGYTNFSDDLTSAVDDNFDIMQVYRAPKEYSPSTLDSYKRLYLMSRVWERDTSLRITLKDIAKLFGAEKVVIVDDDGDVVYRE